MIRRYAILLATLIAIALLVRAQISIDLGAVKRFVIPLAVIYLDTFNNPATAIALSMAMTLVGFGILFYYWLVYFRPADHELKQVVNVLSSMGDPPGSPTAFAKIEEALSGSGLLARGWRRYKGRIRHGNNGSMALEPPDHYFGVIHLHRTELPINMLRGIAADYVGIGLIFTFLGLVAGLYFASRSMLSADLGSARLALIQLLHASTFKFLTSITGIGMSLAFTWAHRLLIAQIERRIDKITAVIEEKLPATAYEDLGTDSLRLTRLVRAGNPDECRPASLGHR